MNLMNQTPIFTPASLLTCYNSALKVAVEAYPITVQGIYRPDRMNKLYGGVFYDRLIQESGKEELVIKVRPAQREQLSGKAEKLITIYGFVNRKVRPDSVIGVSLDLESVLNVEESKVSEDEKQFWNLQREKAQSGKKDVSLLFKNRLFSNEKPRVALLWATSSCTRTEFNNAAGNARASNLYSWTLLSQILPKLSGHSKRWTGNMMPWLWCVAVVPVSKYLITMIFLAQ